ncbi:unnamed protein product [Closterium sp. NIES-64]|nr:unnamed protein product [Closterium sp. NIES-64]
MGKFLFILPATPPQLCLGPYPNRHRTRALFSLHSPIAPCLTSPSPTPTSSPSPPPPPSSPSPHPLHPRPCHRPGPSRHVCCPAAPGAVATAMAVSASVGVEG